MSSLKTEALSGVKWNGIKNAVVSIVKVLQVAILARFLSKEDFGLVGIALLLNSFSTIFVSMGFGTVVMHEKNLTKTKFSSLYWTNILLGFVISFVVFLSAPLVANYYNREELNGVIHWTSLLIFVNSITSLQQTVQQKQMNFRFITILTLLSTAVVFVLNILLAAAGYGVFSLVWSSLVGSTIIAIVYLYVGFFKEKNILYYFRFDDIKEALKIGSYQMGSQILEFFSREMDSIILSSTLSMSFFGVYSLCKNLSSHLYAFVNPIITGVLTPVYSKIQDESSRIKATYIKSLDLLGGVNYLLYGIIASAAIPLLGILYGPSYTEYGLVLLCLCVYYAQQSLGNPVGSLIIAKGRTDLGLLWSIFRIIFVSSYMYCFAKYGGVTLFLIMLAILPLFLQYPSWYILLRKLIDISFGELMVVVLKPLALAIPLLSLYYLGILISNPFVSGVVIAVLYISIYLCLLYYFRRSFFREMVSAGVEMVTRSKK